MKNQEDTDAPSAKDLYGILRTTVPTAEQEWMVKRMDDLISRQALYEKTAEWEAQALHMVEKTMNDEDLTEWKRWSTILKERSAFKFDVADAPSAQPERKKGEWLKLTNTNHTYVCSVCGRMLVNITDGKNTVTKNYPFCHCGADMRGESDG